MNRNETILKYESYAKGIAINTCAIKGVRDSRIYDDCKSIAIEILINAIDNYDESKGASVKTFVAIKVKGGILDHFRKSSGRNCTEKIALLKLNFSNPGDIDSFRNSLVCSVNGTESKVCNKDLVHKIFQHVDNTRCRDDTSEIFRLYFYDGYTMQEIGDMKGVTDSRISQIIGKISREIRKAFKQELLEGK